MPPNRQQGRGRSPVLVGYGEPGHPGVWPTIAAGGLLQEGGTGAESNRREAGGRGALACEGDQSREICDRTRRRAGVPTRERITDRAGARIRLGLDGAGPGMRSR
jgi:hypothetical protein